MNGCGTSLCIRFYEFLSYLNSISSSMWIILLVAKKTSFHIRKEIKAPENTKLVFKLLQTLLKQEN